MKSRSNHAARPRPAAHSHRAERLRLEAANCIAIAIETANDPFAADLIDEATRLSTRARQIAKR